MIYAIPIAALVISAGSLIYAYFGLRQKSSEQYTRQLEMRLATLETELAEALLRERILQAEHRSLLRAYLKEDSGG